MSPAPTNAHFFRTSGAGYAHRGYAESLGEFGAVQELLACGGWLLVRRLPVVEAVDAMGCYPMFSCRDWNAIGADLEALAQTLVCVSLVTDPFAHVSPARLCATFPDVCFEFKQHFVTDLSHPLDTVAGSHHRRNVRKSLAAVEVRETTGDASMLDDWLPLYEHLIRRHAISGIAGFSRDSFARQAKVPGFRAFSAVSHGEVCGMTLWYVDGDVCYYHLAAYNDRGYELRASYALFWSALTEFAKTGVRWAGLGAGAGVTASQSGLTRFKQGWSTHTRPAYFCGRIMQPAVYRKLATAEQLANGFFPAYRGPLQTQIA